MHGVSIDAAVLPTGWQERAIEVRNENTRDNTGWCVEAHDLAASKLVAFRDKDKDFVRTLLVGRARIRGCLGPEPAAAENGKSPPSCAVSLDV